MRFSCIRKNKGSFPIPLMCRVLEVSPSGYYAWLSRKPARRSEENRHLRAHVEVVFRASRKSYGSPRVTRELKEQGRSVGRHRVARIMRESGLYARRTKRFRSPSDNSAAKYVSPNRLNRQFEVAKKNRAWVCDTTCVPTRQGWVHLAVVLDLYSRRIVGWATARELNERLTMDALRRAVEQRRPGPGLLHHSDQGRAYSSHGYRALLKHYQMVTSMSRVGNCWDNAVAESFFKSLKVECIYRNRYLTREQAEQDIAKYIDQFYNINRRHSFLGLVSPVHYELMKATN